MRVKVLVVNCGSSSVKYQLFDMENEAVLAKGLAERVGETKEDGAKLTHERNGEEEFVIEADFPSHTVALKLIGSTLVDKRMGVLTDLSEIDAVGHRVVHGAERFNESVPIDDEVLEAVHQCCEVAPLHNPPNLMGIRAAQELLPGVPQVAVFDTSFHTTLPKHAYLYAIPMEFYRRFGVRRYGFHGTSHRYVTRRAMGMLKEMGCQDPIRIVTCHLGNGCSMAAVVDGKVVDTTMGFTPLEGLVMGTRSGDVDPALIAYLAARLDKEADDITAMLNKQSGLTAMSGVGNDMRDILAARNAGSEDAATAVKVFCYRIRKYIGSYAAAMGGLDAVVFTAGIGENCPAVRAEVCEGLEFLGLRIDPALNAQRDDDRDISLPEATAHVLVIGTNEELMIARDTRDIVAGPAE